MHAILRYTCYVRKRVAKWCILLIKCDAATLDDQVRDQDSNLWYKYSTYIYICIRNNICYGCDKLFLLSFESLSVPIHVRGNTILNPFWKDGTSWMKMDSVLQPLICTSWFITKGPILFVMEGTNINASRNDLENYLSYWGYLGCFIWCVCVCGVCVTIDINLCTEYVSCCLLKRHT